MTKRKKQKPKSTTLVRREPPTVAEAIEKVLIGGDLAQLSVEQRLQYYNALCKSLGLNPLTKPFAYIQLNGKLVLYALRDCTDQLRKIHNVSVTRLETSAENGMYIAKVEVRDKNGRTDAASGAVWIEQLKALDLANALMKAETKAKRRATLSICGMGMLDESELDTIQDKHFLTENGRVIHEVGERGTREAAQAVAQRKISEHAAKVSENKTKPLIGIPGPRLDNSLEPHWREISGNPIGSPETDSNGRNEALSLVPYKEGLIALSGPGLSILRSEMTEDDKAFFGIKLHDKSVYCLEEKLAFKFQDLCTRLGVTATWAEPAKPVQPKQEYTPGGLPKAIIPPAPVFPDQPPPAQSTDPILFEAKAITPKGKKAFMLCKWNGGEHSTFDKGLWPILLAAIGKPVMLETKAKGQYSNLVSIVRVDGIEFQN